MSQVIANNQSFVSGAPLTTVDTEVLAPGMLLSDIDRRITKVKPMATPVDQITRHFGARKAGAMNVAYYSVECKPGSDTLETAVAEKTFAANRPLLFTLTPVHTAWFEPTETILLPEVKMDDGNGLVLYVVSKSDDLTALNVIPVNPDTRNGLAHVPALAAGTSLVRMGRVASELDVQTAQFEALPTKSENYCQIFKMQVEQSTFQKMADKEVNWTFTDQEEIAVADMRMGMERSFLFGVKANITDSSTHREVRLTGGIWNQAGSEYRCDVSKLTETTLIDICSRAFASSSGSGKKFIFAGTGFVDALSKIETTKVRMAADTYTRYGLQFHEIVSNYGSLFLIYSPIFDMCGHRNDAFIVDPDLVTKYCHIPFRTDTLDLRKAGIRNTDAVVITEASCVVLRQPAAHMRIIGTPAQEPASDASETKTSESDDSNA